LLRRCRERNNSGASYFPQAICEEISSSNETGLKKTQSVVWVRWRPGLDATSGAARVEEVCCDMQRRSPTPIRSDRGHPALQAFGTL
jgi:hypothetical protein